MYPQHSQAPVHILYDSLYDVLVSPLHNSLGSVRSQRWIKAISANRPRKFTARLGRIHNNIGCSVWTSRLGYLSRWCRSYTEVRPVAWGYSVLGTVPRVALQGVT